MHKTVRMQITRVETFKVVVPLKPNAWNSPEFGPDVWDERPIVIMKVHTDTGIVGLGELGKGKPEESVHRDAPAFVGKSPLEFNLEELPSQPPAREGYEMALYDIIGKAYGVPVYQLLGGKYRNKIPVAFCSGHRTPQDAATQARAAAEQGFKTYKCKASGSWENLPERVRLIHETAGPGIAVRIDPNQKLSTPALAVSIADRLAGYNVECLESPVDQRNLDWYVLLRQKLHVPLALHLHHPQEVIAAVKREACDYINLGGGMLHFKYACAISEAAGVPNWHGSGVGLAISDASFIHTCAATKSATLPSDIVGTLLRQDDLIRSPLQYEDGCVYVPEEPGLGVELDEEALEKWGVK